MLKVIIAIGLLAATYGFAEAQSYSTTKIVRLTNSCNNGNENACRQLDDIANQDYERTLKTRRSVPKNHDNEQD
ncbi:MAG: hypothetical protein ACJ8AW_11370 [Rhodopila sp.]